jgi:heat shock protein HslJ
MRHRPTSVADPGVRGRHTNPRLQFQTFLNATRLGLPSDAFRRSQITSGKVASTFVRSGRDMRPKYRALALLAFFALVACTRQSTAPAATSISTTPPAFMVESSPSSTVTSPASTTLFVTTSSSVDVAAVHAIVADLGCNDFFAEGAAIANGRLELKNPSQTAAGCPAGIVADREQMLRSLFESRPTVEIAGDLLTLRVLVQRPIDAHEAALSRPGWACSWCFVLPQAVFKAEVGRFVVGEGRVGFGRWG